MADVLTFTCQHDNCAKTGTDRSQFKKAIAQLGSGLTLQYVLCNEHAEGIPRTNQGENK